MNLKYFGTQSRLKILHILLTVLVMLNLMLWPLDWISRHTYSLSVALSLLAIIVAPKRFAFNHGTKLLSSLSLIFCLVHFSGLFHANSPSLVWTKSFHWLFLAATLFFGPTLFTQVKADYWKRVFFCLALINCLFIWAGILFAMVSTEASGFSYVESRIAGSYFNKNDNYISVLLAIQLPIIFILRRDRFLTKHIFYLLMSVVLGAIVMLSSRAVLGASLIGILFMTAIDLGKSRKIFDLIPKLLIFLMGTSIFLRLVLKDWNTFLHTLNPLRFAQDYTWNERITLWKKTWQLFTDHVIFGVGSGNWITEVWQFGIGDLGHSRNRPAVYHHAHNYILEVLAETGLVGGGILLALACSVIYLTRTAKSKTAQLLFVGVCMYVLMSNFYGICYTHVHIHSPLQWVFAIYLVALANQPASPSNISTRRPLLVKSLGITVLTCCCVWAVFIRSKTTDFQRYQASSRKLDPPLAVETINEIYQPHFFEYYRQKNIKTYIAMAKWRNGEAAKAMQYLHMSLQENPYDHREFMRLGNWYKTLGESAAAHESYLQAFALNSRNQRFNITLAKSALEQQDWETFEKALAFYEKEIIPWFEKYRDGIRGEKTAREKKAILNVTKRADEVLDLRKKRLAVTSPKQREKSADQLPK